jgi:GNAT superfamily N-acetyltransferase
MNYETVDVHYIQNNKSDLNQVAELFCKLYNGEKELGISIPLIEKGELMWIETMKKGLGKFTQIVVAEDKGRIVGFIAGFIKIMPPYFGSVLVGYYDSIYVLSDYRKRGISDRLTLMLINWWLEKKVKVFEVERMLVNEKAARSFERLGFKPELLKYRRLAEE